MAKRKTRVMRYKWQGGRTRQGAPAGARSVGGTSTKTKVLAPNLVNKVCAAPTILSTIGPSLSAVFCPQSLMPKKRTERDCTFSECSETERSANAAKLYEGKRSPDQR